MSRWSRWAAVLLIFVWWRGFAEPGSYRFAILGDRTGQAQKGVYEQAWREIAASKPNFVLSVGDTIQGGNDATMDAEWKALEPLFAQYKQFPLYLTPGNHDIWSAASEKKFAEVTRRPVEYSFTVENAFFVVLDTSRTEQLSDEQLKFVDAELAKSKAPLKFVVMHKPVWLLPMMMQNLQFPLHVIAKKHKVTAVIAGHVHNLMKMEREGVLYFLVGSSGGHLRASTWNDGWFFQFMMAEVEGTRVRFSVKELDAPFGEGRKFSLEQWDERGGLKSAAAR
jgi:predicted phosphodiesterase